MNLDELQRLAEGATPGPWDVDSMRNDGEYGNNGPDTRSGFDSYAIFDASGRALFDSLNRDGSATSICEEGDSYDGYFHAWDDSAKRDATYIAAMSPDTAKKLIAAARAALALLPILEEHLFERGPEEEALRSALEELK